jgi:non-ribosomal peptide synthase protein (TIGR01720 family)
LLEDLETLYRQLSQGEAIHLPPKTTSFKQWAELLAQYAQSEKVQEESDYWLTRPWERVSRLPVDRPGEENVVASTETVTVSLDVEETQALLREVPQAYRTQINDVLLTALAQAFARWTGRDALLVGLEGHGREEIVAGVNLSRTVGWFTSLFPVLLDLGEAQGPGEALKSVKEQLRQIPDRGVNYGVLRYLSGDARVAEVFQALPQLQVSFNYLGQLDQVLPKSSAFGLAPEPSGPHLSPRGVRPVLVEVNGHISRERLQMTWTYSENLHRRSTIEGLAQGFIQALRAIIEHCRSSEAGGYTPSDFPAAKLSQEELDRFTARISRAGGGSS